MIGRMYATMHFNSRPSARGDGVSSVSLPLPCISIHAPPRGATSCVLLPQTRRPFQFTPLREGRPCGGFRRLRRRYFNSRPSARGDHHYRWEPRSHEISIHAPPRGATPSVSPCSSLLIISIHAPPRGATRGFCGGFLPHLFQFTPLREGRPSRNTFASCHILFQFTPLREGRPVRNLEEQIRQLFQFTPLREGRPERAVVGFHLRQFQFTPLREGRQLLAG